MADIEKLLTHQAIDLPEIQALEWDDGIETFRRGQLAEQVGTLIMGYAAAGVEVAYGEHSLEQFAREVDAAPSTVREHRRIYKRIARLDSDARAAFLRALQAGILGIKHFRIANPLPDDESYVRLLTAAHDENMSTRKFAEEVAVERGLSVPTVEPDPEAQDNGYEEGSHRLSKRASDALDAMPSTGGNTARFVVCPMCHQPFELGE